MKRTDTKRDPELTPEQREKKITDVVLLARQMMDEGEIQPGALNRMLRNIQMIRRVSRSLPAEKG